MPLTWALIVTPCQACAAPRALTATGMSSAATFAVETATLGGLAGFAGLW